MIKIYLPNKNEPVVLEGELNEHLCKNVIAPLLNAVPEDAREYPRIELPEVSVPLIVRPRTSDILAFLQIFGWHEYDLQIKPAELKPTFIIDGGANVGYSAVYFAGKYPDARIIAVEPEESNFQVLSQNTAGFSRIKPVCSAIWNKNTNLKIKDIGLDKWGFMVEEAGPDEPGSFKAITVGELLKEAEPGNIIMVKLDIEGAEKEVFSSNYEDWLGKVDILVIELHERMKKGADKAFNSAVKKYRFSRSQKGENHILIKKTR